jgi:magnesium-transporting ATPase (P-type)
MMAVRILSPEELAEFQKEYFAASDSKEDKDAAIDLVADKWENNFTLIGATAVEDKLQDKVPETIADLLRANIKVWMLTGDKLETAENIAKSCRLI